MPLAARPWLPVQVEWRLGKARRQRMLAVSKAWHARMLKNRAITQLRKRIVAVSCIRTV